MSRKIVVFTGNRSEYGLLRPVIKELCREASFEISLIISASHLDRDFGETLDEIELRDIRKIKKIKKIKMRDVSQDGKSILFQTISTIVDKGSKILKDLNPDFIILAGDRYETFAMAIAAFYMNIPIAHLFGGDLTEGGHFDDSVRHSITKLAHLHFTSNEDSYQRVLGLGEERWRVFNAGSPAVDNFKNKEYAFPEELAREFKIDLNQPIVLFTQHPVAAQIDAAYEQAKQSLEALKELRFQTMITYPCPDPGSEDMIKAIEEYADVAYFRIQKSLGVKRYFGFLAIASVVVGNSSSGIIETPLFKVPCVNIGTRQKGRLRAENVIDVIYDKEQIKNAVRKAIEDKGFKDKVRGCVNPYGQGSPSQFIVNKLKTIPINRLIIQKRMEIRDSQDNKSMLSVS